MTDAANQQGEAAWIASTALVVTGNGASPRRLNWIAFFLVGVPVAWVILKPIWEGTGG